MPPTQAAIGGNVNYDQLSYGQLRELCKQRGYHRKNSRAAPKARWEAMDAADRKTKEGSPNEIDTSMTVLGKRSQNDEGAAETGTCMNGNTE